MLLGLLQSTWEKLVEFNKMKLNQLKLFTIRNSSGYSIFLSSDLTGQRLDFSSNDFFIGAVKKA